MAYENQTVGRIENVTIGPAPIGDAYREAKGIGQWQHAIVATKCSGDTHVRFCPHCDTCQCGKAKLTK